jgi:HSP90 family molecular chaperone
MGSKTLRSKQIIVTVPEDRLDLIERFNKIRIVKGQKRLDAIFEAIEDYVSFNSDQIAGKNWVTWSELAEAMKARGFSISRVTFWQYENTKPEFAAAIVKDGVDVLFDLDAILAIYEGKKEEVTATA